MADPAWLTVARRYEGVREISGAQHSTVIAGWLDRLRAWWKDDETPWCGVYVAACIQAANLPLPRYWMRARDWLNWGQPLPGPAHGCVVVFERGSAGHVGFVIGQTSTGHLMVLGGNQGNAVSRAAFERSRVLGYRWPSGVPLPISAPLVVMNASGPVSSNEA